MSFFKPVNASPQKVYNTQDTPIKHMSVKNDVLTSIKNTNAAKAKVKRYVER